MSEQLLTLEIDQDDQGRLVVAWKCGENGGYSDTVEGAVDDATAITGIQFPRRKVVP